MYNLGYERRYRKCDHLYGSSIRRCMNRQDRPHSYSLYNVNNDGLYGPDTGILTGVAAGVRGTVCDDGFGMNEGHAACKTIGYTGAVKVSNVGSDSTYTSKSLFNSNGALKYRTTNIYYFGSYFRTISCFFALLSSLANYCDTFYCILQYLYNNLFFILLKIIVCLYCAIVRTFFL